MTPAFPHIATTERAERRIAAFLSVGLKPQLLASLCELLAANDRHDMTGDAA